MKIIESRQEPWYYILYILWYPNAKNLRMPKSRAMDSYRIRMHWGFFSKTKNLVIETNVVPYLRHSPIRIPKFEPLRRTNHRFASCWDRIELRRRWKSGRKWANYLRKTTLFHVARKTSLNFSVASSLPGFLSGWYLMASLR